LRKSSGRLPRTDDFMCRSATTKHLIWYFRCTLGVSCRTMQPPARQRGRRRRTRTLNNGPTPGASGQSCRPTPTVSRVAWALCLSRVSNLIIHTLALMLQYEGTPFIPHQSSVTTSPQSEASRGGTACVAAPLPTAHPSALPVAPVALQLLSKASKQASKQQAS